MSSHSERDRRGDSSPSISAGDASQRDAGVPGKHTLVEVIAPVQRMVGGEASAPDDASIHAAAARGTATPASPLPHRDQIQRLFGRHDVSSIEAHTGGAAAESARDMNAQAYATGNHVVLGGSADLHTVAHEAAHVVQQRGGVQLKGGVGAVGDAHEQHADEVADKVVRGESAEPLLDRYAGGGSGGEPVQRIIEGYKSPTLRSNSKVFEGANDQQKQQLQALHDAPQTYTVDQARQQVGLPPLNTGSGGPTPPFPFRYAQSGPSTMTTVTEGHGGLVMAPRIPPSQVGGEAQISVVADSQYADTPSTSKRAIGQTAVMDNTSPNDAAAQLGFTGRWEWLHLVAFSIGGTHVLELSDDSFDLMGRTGQSQQIQENLVLGTHEANTAMLSWETALKRTMRAHPGLKLQLSVIAIKENKQVINQRGETTTIPLASKIKFDFLFKANDRATPPGVLVFDAQSHAQPPMSEFAQVVAAVDRLVQSGLAAPGPVPHGIHTDAMDTL